MAARQHEANRLQSIHTQLEQYTRAEREKRESNRKQDRQTMRTKIQRNACTRKKKMLTSELIHSYLCSHSPSCSDLSNCVHLHDWSTCQFIVNTCGSGGQSHWSATQWLREDKPMWQSHATPCGHYVDEWSQKWTRTRITLSFVIVMHRTIKHITFDCEITI